MITSTHFLLQLLIIMLPASVSAQNQDGLIDPRPGYETTKPYKLDDSGQIRQIAAGGKAGGLLTTLPPEVMKHHPELLAISDFDSDGKREVFIAWPVLDHRPTEQLRPLQVYRAGSGQTATLVHQFQIEAMPVWVDFPVVPGGKKINAAIVRVLGGAKWCTYYLMFPGGKSLVTLGEASHLKLADLDGDGTYEWILLQWRGWDLKCQYGFFGTGNSADIFRLSGEEFTRIWPPPGWAILDGDIESEISFGYPQPQGWKSDGTPVSRPWKPIPWGKTYLVMNRFYDVDDDGRVEMVTITGIVSRNDMRRRLSIYRLRRNQFDRLAFTAVSPGYPAIAIMGVRRLKDRKQIVLRLADARRCGEDTQKYEEGVVFAAGFDFKDGSLKLSWVNDKIDITLWAFVRDLDQDGEEEMIFSREGVNQSLPQGPAQKKPVLLRSINEFLPYTSSR